MRLVMMGTGPFAVPTFRALLDSRHELAALVTNPVRGAREGFVPATPTRDVARERGLPILDPEDVNAEDARRAIADLRADLMVVCDYGQILSAQTLAAARLGGVNLHGSLLPRYRGAAPINWAIYHGEPQTGVSVIHITPRVDAGPVIAQAATAIGPDETAVDLEPRLAELGAPLVREAIEQLERGLARPIPQDPALACKAPRLKKTDGLIDWSRPAAAIRNQYRALEPWPRTYTLLPKKGGPLRLIVGPLEIEPRQLQNVEPGTVLEAANDRLVVATGQDAIVVRGVHPAGKRPMTIDEFLRGRPLVPGDRFVQQ